MSQLKIEHIKRGSLSVHKITGFTDKEISELNSMDYREMKHIIMDALVSRRLIPYGLFILNAWIDGNAAYIETGVQPND